MATSLSMPLGSSLAAMFVGNGVTGNSDDTFLLFALCLDLVSIYMVYKHTLDIHRAYSVYRLIVLTYCVAKRPKILRADTPHVR